MINRIVSLFILVTYFISGCEDSTVNTTMTKDPQKVTKELNQVKEATEKKPVTSKQTKKIFKKKLPQPKIKEVSDLTDPPHNKQVLDLTIPQTSGINKSPTASNKTPNDKQREYLPDLFSDKKNHKSDTVKIDGKVIRKDELEKDKQRPVDGVGIGIKLTP